MAAEVDTLGAGGDVDREGRMVQTDHGAFVLINVVGGSGCGTLGHRAGVRVVAGVLTRTRRVQNGPRPAQKSAVMLFGRKP